MLYPTKVSEVIVVDVDHCKRLRIPKTLQFSTSKLGSGFLKPQSSIGEMPTSVRRLNARSLFAT